MKRIQRQRTKAFKLPPNTRCCTRGTKWGNPYKIVRSNGGTYSVWRISDGLQVHYSFGLSKEAAVNDALYLYGVLLNEKLRVGLLDLSELKSYDYLACFCSLEQKCHVDIIIQKLEEMK